jgi:hypothetical protein
MPKYTLYDDNFYTIKQGELEWLPDVILYDKRVFLIDNLRNPIFATAYDEVTFMEVK